MSDLDLKERLRIMGGRAFPHEPKTRAEELATEAADRIAALEDALRPFATAADDLDDNHSGHIWEAPAAMNLTAEDLRAAARLLTQGDA